MGVSPVSPCENPMRNPAKRGLRAPHLFLSPQSFVPPFLGNAVEPADRIAPEEEDERLE